MSKEYYDWFSNEKAREAHPFLTKEHGIELIKLSIDKGGRERK